MNFDIKRTDSTDSSFVELVRKLDIELAVRNGDQDEFFKQFNAIDTLDHVVVVYVDEIAAACGAFKEFDESSVEIKRMYTGERFRGLRLAAEILKELELWAKELGYKSCVLETGRDMLSAVNLYRREDYKEIPRYGQYKDVETSVCMEKYI